MIKINNGNILESKADFIVNVVDTDNGIGTEIENLYPHVDIEYRKYIRYCKKNKITIAGTVQYVPFAVWAIGLVDTMKNNRLEKCNGDFNYVVNIFGQIDNETMLPNLDVLNTGINDVLNKANEIEATIAISYKLYNQFQKVFDDSNLTIEVWKE